MITVEPERGAKTTEGTAAQGTKWLVTDVIRGSDETSSRLNQEHNYVLAVSETYPIWMDGRRRTAELLAAVLPEEAWVPLTAGEGGRGQHVHEWAWLKLPCEQREETRGRRSWLLVQRSLHCRRLRRYFWASGPAETMLFELVSIASRHWVMEEAGLKRSHLNQRG